MRPFRSALERRQPWNIQHWHRPGHPRLRQPAHDPCRRHLLGLQELLVAVHRRHRRVERQVCAVVNFPPRQIGPFISEVLTLGMPDEDGAVVLVRPDLRVPNGGKLF
jgi:hypothetical protein